jgi:hypothetical protein
MATFVNNVPVNSNYLNDLIDPVIYYRHLKSKRLI